MTEATILAPQSGSDQFFCLTLEHGLKVLEDGSVLTHVMYPRGRSADCSSITYNEAYVHDCQLTHVKAGHVYMPVPVQTTTVASTLYSIEAFAFVYDNSVDAALTIDGVRVLLAEEDALVSSAIYKQYECPMCSIYSLSVHDPGASRQRFTRSPTASPTMLTSPPLEAASLHSTPPTARVHANQTGVQRQLQAA
jgi:hypothetical protein